MKLFFTYICGIFCHKYIHSWNVKYINQMNRVKTFCWLLLVAFSLSFISCSDGKKDSGIGVAANRVMRERVELPQGKAKADKVPMASITITKELKYHFKDGNNTTSEPMSESQLEEALDQYFEDDSEKSVALYLDENVLLSDAVKVLDIANRKKYNMVLATRRPDASDK